MIIINITTIMPGMMLVDPWTQQMFVLKCCDLADILEVARHWPRPLADYGQMWP